MPRYRVKEIRARNSEYVIDAVDERAASKLDGTLIEENGDADDYTQEIVSIEEVDDDS